MDQVTDQGVIGAGAGGDSSHPEGVQNEVIEVSSDEETGPEVETVNLFDFCIDQVVNGSTQEERQLARDLMVNNFDEIDQHELPLLDNIVRKGKQALRQNAPLVMPSTFQVNSTRPSRKCTQKQLDYRKYRQKLKQNAVKYQKVLENNRDYQKQRLERMTEGELEAQKEYQRLAQRKYHAKQSASNKFACKLAQCGKSFSSDALLVNHERIHLGVKPFSCTWDNCSYSSAQHGAVLTHIRMVHFKLPQSVKAQQRLKIEDNRNANHFIQVDTRALARRLQ